MGRTAALAPASHPRPVSGARGLGVNPSRHSHGPFHLSLSHPALNQDEGVWSLVIIAVKKIKSEFMLHDCPDIPSAVLTFANVVGRTDWYLKRRNILHIQVLYNSKTLLRYNQLSFFSISSHSVAPGFTSCSPVILPSVPLPLSTHSFHYGPFLPFHFTADQVKTWFLFLPFCAFIFFVWF